MGILVCLRTDPQRSYFKDVLSDLIMRYRPTEILISSGYYGEFDTNPPAPGTQSRQFYASADEGSNGLRFADVLSGDRRLETIRLIGSCDWRQKGSNSPNSYANQLKNLRDNLRTALPGRQVIAYDSNNGHWHAKTTILLNGDTAVAGVVGSSNYTSSAFGGRTQSRTNPYFNFESDTFLYDPEFDTTVAGIVTNLQDDDYAPGFIVGDLAPDQDISAILKEHYDKIMATVNSGAFTIMP